MYLWKQILHEGWRCLSPNAGTTFQNNKAEKQNNAQRTITMSLGPRSKICLGWNVLTTKALFCHNTSRNSKLSDGRPAMRRCARTMRQIKTIFVSYQIRGLRTTLTACEPLHLPCWTLWRGWIQCFQATAPLCLSHFDDLPIPAKWENMVKTISNYPHLTNCVMKISTYFIFFNLPFDCSWFVSWWEGRTKGCCLNMV